MSSRFDVLNSGSPDLVASDLVAGPILEPREVLATLINAFTRLGQLQSSLRITMNALTKVEEDLDKSRIRVAGLQARLARLEGRRPAPGAEAEADGESDTTVADLAASWNPPAFGQEGEPR